MSGVPSAKASDGKPNTPAPVPESEQAFSHGFAKLPDPHYEEYDANQNDPGSTLPVDSRWHDTYYLVVDDDDEKRIAEAWVSQHAPNLPHANLVSTLWLDKLSERSEIAILNRVGTRRNPVPPSQPIVGKTPEGQLLHEKADPRVLADSMKAYGAAGGGPIKVASFWHKSATRFSSHNGLQREDLIAEIARVSGCAIRYRDVTSVLPGMLPRQLYLTRV